MKYILFGFGCIVIFLSGCNLREREKLLQQKEVSLNQKEQKLLLREQSLTSREAALTRQRMATDSLRVRPDSLEADTTVTVNPALAGRWEVQMTCTETTCPKSAVGDSKTEVWDLAYYDKDVTVKTMVNGKFVRVYRGALRGDNLELTNTQQAQSDAHFLIRIQVVNNTKMQGLREIVRIAEGCRLVYALELNKID